MRNHKKSVFGHLSAFKAFTVLTIAGMMIFLAVRLPEPAVDWFLEKDIRLAAEVWQSRILQQLDAGASSFEDTELTAKDRTFLGNVPKTSDVHRVSFIDDKGKIFYSTLASLNGKVHDEGLFHKEILQGQTYYQIKMLPSEEVEGLQLHKSSKDHYEIREVAVIDLPVFHNGKFVGTIEFQQDITFLRETSLQRVRMMIGLMVGVGIMALFAGLVFIMRINRQQIELVQGKADHDREVLDEQMRLSREVRLLGELNEWLQSSRSLDELFDMVSRFMTHMLTDCEGSIYVYSNSRDVLDGCSSWNGAAHKDHIHPEECWGLRRGRTYAFGDNEIDFYCAHTEEGDDRPYICFPILAHGETVGLLHLRARSGISNERFLRV